MNFDAVLASPFLSETYSKLLVTGNEFPKCWEYDLIMLDI